MGTTFKKSMIALLAVLLLAVIAALTLNLGFLKGFVEQRLSETTGLAVEIPGSLDLRLGTQVLVKASQVSVSNPAWSGEKQVAFIEGLTVNASLGELLSDTVRIRNIEIAKLVLSLEQDARSASNWAAPAAAAESQTKAPLQIDSLNIASGSGSFRSPRLDEPLQWEIGSLRQEITPDDAMLLEFDGTIGQQPALMTLSGGPWNSIAREGSASFEVEARLGNVTLNGSAAFDQLWSPHRPQLVLNLSGPDASELTDVLGIHGLGRGPLSLEIVTRDKDGQLEVDAKGSVGELRIDASGHADSVSTLTKATVDLQLAGPNFGRLARLAGFEAWPESRFDAKLRAALNHPSLEIQELDLALAGARVALSGTIPQLPQISGAEIELSAEGPALAPFAAVAGLDEVPSGPFSVSGKVYSADANTVVNLDYKTTLANGSVAGTIGAGQSLEGTELEIRAGRSSAAELGRSLGIEGLPEAPWRFVTSMNIPDAKVYQLRETSIETSGLSARFRGQLGRESLRIDSDVHFEVAAERLSDLQSLAGESIKLPEQAFTATGRVVAVSGGWRLEQVIASVAQDRIQASGLLGSGAGLDGTRLSLTGSGTNAARFLPDDYAFKLPRGTYELASELSVQDGRVTVSDTRFISGPLSARGSADIPWPMNGDKGQFDLAVDSQDITALMPRIGTLELRKNPLELKVKGHWRDGRIQFDVADLKAGLSTLNVKGTLDLPPNLSATNLQINAYSPDLSALGKLQGQPEKTVKLELKTVFEGTPTKLTMSRFDGRLGDSIAHGDMSVDFEPDVPDFNLVLGSPSLDLRPFLAGNASADQTPGASGSEDAMIPDFEFPIAALAAAQGRFEIQAGTVVLKNMTLRDTVLRGTLREGALDITELSTAGYRSRLNATIKLAPLAEGTARLSTSVRSDGLVFNLADQPVKEKELLPAFDIDISMTGDGKGLRQAAGGMNGTVMIGSEGGQIPNHKARSAAGLFLAEILSTISPSASRQDYIQISCFATAADIRNGVVALDPGTAVQSEKLNLFVTGKINLASEKLDVSLRTETRKAIDLSASELFSPYVKLSGTLSSPSLKIDTKGTLLSGGAAYLSGGLSILAKKALDQLGGTSNPCDGYLETKAADKQP